MKRRVLGRGLDALIPGAARTAGSDLLLVDIDRVSPNRFQPRSHFDREALQELADSIRENGVVQPIVLRPAGDRYELIAGERRWRAAQIAGLQKVPAVVKSVSDDRLLELALVENIQREDLNPLETARGYQMLLDDHALTQEQVAKKVGKKRSSVANYLRLLKLPEPVKTFLAAGKLEMGHARAIAAVEDGGQQEKLAREVVEKGLSVRQVERMVEGRAAGAGSSKSVKRPGGPDPNVGAAEEALTRALGCRVSIRPSRRGGTVAIRYASTGELDRLYSILLQAGKR